MSRSAQRAARAMMVSPGLAGPWGGGGPPSVMYRLGTANDRRWASPTPSFSLVAMRQPPTRWAYRLMVIVSVAPAAVRISSIFCLGGVDQETVVVALAVGEAGHRQAEPVGALGQGDGVVVAGQEFAHRAEGGPVHVV